MSMVQALHGGGQKLGGVNVLAPHLQVHIHVGQGDDMNNGPNHNPGPGHADFPIDLSKLSKSALSEVAYQLCIICLQPYSGDNDCKLLPCGHHYCTRCVAQEVERLLGQQEQT